MAQNIFFTPLFNNINMVTTQTSEAEAT